MPATVPVMATGKKSVYVSHARRTVRKLTDVLAHAHAYRSEEKKVASTEAFNHVETR